MSASINTQLVKTLITEQFPQYQNLDISPVKSSGIDNRTFHLGDEMLVRLPSATGYAAQVEKEQQWLPKLAGQLAVEIPKPLHMGKPSQDYPWNWSIYNWIPGESLNHLTLNETEKQQLAKDLAKFIKKLHQVPTKGAPEGGLHNYYRACHPSVYDQAAREDIEKLSGVIDSAKALAVWEKAIASKWQKDSVWVHGDMAIGNILLRDNKLAAVIDFGCMSIGDPACDLVIAWTFFDNEARKIFKQAIDLDLDTWNRARGWALWKADFELAALNDKTSIEAKLKLKIINELINNA